MPSKLTLALLPVFIASVFASPSSLNIEGRASNVDTSSHCGQYDTVTAGTYTLFVNLWGKKDATSGSQCSNINSLSGNTIAWKTTWNWVGGTGIKSYSNIQQNAGINKQLSAIKSIPTTWKWSQKSSGSIVADVAYDLFTADTAGGSNVNEIMIWLANYNAKPISFNWSAQGDPIPVATSVSLAGHTWNVYSGSNGANNVFSFLPSNGGVLTSFSGDLKVFFDYLVQHQGVQSSQYLVTAQAGTEPTTGSATLTTSSYSLVIN
ncbi:concanavalin A-like lectin/glucanase domain-containing protein [Irpex lacteus]|nr:concanavalin A-like lectin/glucanase domain-containing protein [Irpex lacteus]